MTGTKRANNERTSSGEGEGNEGPRGNGPKKYNIDGVVLWQREKNESTAQPLNGSR